MNNYKNLILNEIPDLVNMIYQQRETITQLKNDLEELKKEKSIAGVPDNNYKLLEDKYNKLENDYKLLETKYNNLTNNLNDKCINQIDKYQKPSLKSLEGQIYNINSLINYIPTRFGISDPLKKAEINKLNSQKSYIIQQYLFDTMISNHNSEFICDKINKT